MNKVSDSRRPAARINGGDQFDFSPVGIGESAARAIAVHIGKRQPIQSDRLDELKQLVRATGADVCGEITGVRASPHAATYAGKGKTEQIAAMVQERGADLVVFDHALSPIQERNLERALSCRVLDRIGLILDIFAIRARTHEGKLQVELAQLRHLSTRLVRGWSHLERQKGGIGLRGPGETQLETDRRLIGRRMKTLNSRLQKVRSQRALRRRARDRVPIPTISMVGYTNAGKSTLFNSLTGADVYAANQLFATLDPTMRRCELPGFGPVVFSDTVGFIRDLPHGLVRAFHSTLEEVAEAAMLLLVVDSSDHDCRDTIDEVLRVLEEIGAEEVPRITVFNKVDCVDGDPRIESAADGSIRSIHLSAHTGAGTSLLTDAIAGYLSRSFVRRRFRLPPHAGRIRALLHEKGEVVREQVAEDGTWSMEVDMDGSLLSWLDRQPDFESAYTSDA